MIQTDKGHFLLTFKNGYTISVFNGVGSYSENHFKKELFNTADLAFTDSEDCEIAIIYNGALVTRNFIECNDDVKGYVSADELADIIYTVKNFKGDDNVKDRL